MFGGCSYHLFQSILGITQEKGSVGYDKLVIAPKIPQKLQKVSGKMRIPLGEVSVAFEQKDGRYAWDIVIPEKTSAVFRYDKVELKLKEGKHHIRL
jgi:alpha-L-rhamnosidase